MSEPTPAPGVPPPPPAAAASEPEVLEAPPPSRVTGLSCPNCGGTLEVAPGLRVVTCPFCATPLLAVGEVGTLRFAVPPELDRAAAEAVAKGWLDSGWNKHPRLGREAQIGEAFLCYLPFFRVQAEVVGLALGTEERRRTVGSGKNRRTETYEVDVERPVEKHCDHTYPAVNVAEWGVQRVDLAGDRLIPYDAAALERLGMVFAPTGSETAVRDAALERFKESADPRRGLKRVRFFFLETLRERMSMIYYPLWVVRYRFQKRSYQVLVDAEDGRVAYGKAPGNDLYRAVALVGSEAAAAFLATTALQWGMESGDDGCGFAILVALFGLALFGWGWKRFRYGAEVVEGTGVEGGPALDLGPLKSVTEAFVPQMRSRWR